MPTRFLPLTEPTPILIVFLRIMLSLEIIEAELDRKFSM